MTAAPEILVVEDDDAIAGVIAAALKKEGYAVRRATGCADALRLASAAVPDAVLLDLSLPDGDGKDVITALRAWSGLPVIVLSARQQEDEKVAALDAGADDYLSKPFGAGELLARLRVALRHAGRRDRPQEMSYRYKDLQIDFARRQVAVGGQALHLTPREYDLLALLAQKAGQVVTQSELLRAVWGRNAADQDHYLRIYIRKLRQKIGDNPLYPVYIFTEAGIGYRLAEDDA